MQPSYMLLPAATLNGTNYRTYRTRPNSLYRLPIDGSIKSICMLMFTLFKFLYSSLAIPNIYLPSLMSCRQNHNSTLLFFFKQLYATTGKAKLFINEATCTGSCCFLDLSYNNPVACRLPTSLLLQTLMNLQISCYWLFLEEYPKDWGGRLVLKLSDYGLYEF